MAARAVQLDPFTLEEGLQSCAHRAAGDSILDGPLAAGEDDQAVGCQCFWNVIADERRRNHDVPRLDAQGFQITCDADK